MVKVIWLLIYLLPPNHWATSDSGFKSEGECLQRVEKDRELFLAYPHGFVSLGTERCVPYAPVIS